MLFVSDPKDRLQQTAELLPCISCCTREMASFAARRAGVDDGAGGGGGGEEEIAEGLATAFQCFQDGMEEKLQTLATEQAALLVKLEASREASGWQR